LLGIHPFTGFQHVAADIFEQAWTPVPIRQFPRKIENFIKPGRDIVFGPKPKEFLTELHQLISGSAGSRMEHPRI